MTNSTVIAGGTASHAISAGTAPGATSGIPVITGDGVLVLDPDIPLVPLNGAAATVGAFSVTNPQIPTLRVSGGNVGGTSTVDLEAPPGESFFLLVGQPGNSVPLPAFGGELWLNLAATALISAGTIDSTGTQQWSYPVPNTIAVLGVQVHWAALTGIANFRLTSPTGYGHGR